MSVSRTHTTCTLCHAALNTWNVHTCSMCGKTICSRHVHLVKLPHSRVLCSFCADCYKQLPLHTTAHSTVGMPVH